MRKVSSLKEVALIEGRRHRRAVKRKATLVRFVEILEWRRRRRRKMRAG